ncbi:MAG: hypothetical protein NTW76_03995 [Corynebacteriales bacterium]|nr:hypothetical protein [Mycobacteriales bacterium]
MMHPTSTASSTFAQTVAVQGCLSAKQIPAGKPFSDFVDTRFDATVKAATR